jgi:flagellar basal body-associated protein FliL
MNTIPQDQIAFRQLERLAAQRQLYSYAKAVQVAQIILSVPIVILWSIAAVWFPFLQVYAALWGIVIALVSVGLLTPWQQTLQQNAAKIQELFDCDVLRIEWNQLRSGTKPAPESVIEAATAYKKRDPDYTALKNWYPPAVGDLPLHLARIICQRTNIWWDAKLRRRYATYVAGVVASLAIVVLILALINGTTVEELILVGLAPLLPALVLGIRQYTEHREAANNLDRLRESAERIWSNALAGATTQDLEAESRNLQDLIYDNRRKSPLIQDRIYNLLRGHQEAQMNKGAETLVAEAQKYIRP